MIFTSGRVEVVLVKRLAVWIVQQMSSVSKSDAKMRMQKGLVMNLLNFRENLSMKEALISSAGSSEGSWLAYYPFSSPCEQVIISLRAICSLGPLLDSILKFYLKKIVDSSG